MAKFGEKRRNPIHYKEIPQLVINAFLAAEDDRFFEHPGIDYQGILRAAGQLLLTGEKRQGGSTITMQVARNFFLSRDKTYERKIKEILLALKIEHSLSKQEILALYLNKIYLGNRAYGVSAAAEIYYGRQLAELSLAQVAMIAGLPKAPSRYNPVADPERAILRRDYILKRMHDLEYIDETSYQQARSTGITARIHATVIDVNAQHLAEMVRAQMVNTFGEDAYTNGYRVITTIDSKSQQIAQSALRKVLENYDQRHGYRGSEGRLPITQIKTVELMEKALSRYSRIGDLLPGIVVAVEEKSAHVFLGRHLTIQLNWDGMKWTRRYINENKRGRTPETSIEILAIGDVVRVRQENIIVDNENKMTKNIWMLRQKPAVNGAFISLNPDDGAILSLVGGYDFYHSKFNRALQSRRQTGSGFKPVLYTAALEADLTPASTILDTPIIFEDKSTQSGAWRPQNYSNKFFGSTRLRQALYESRNVVSVRLLDTIGIKPVRAVARRFGFALDEVPNNPTASLGSGASAPIRMSAAYAVFANGGYRVKPYFIDQVIDHKGSPVLCANPFIVCEKCTVDDAIDTRPPADDGLFITLHNYTDMTNTPTTLPGNIRPAPQVLSPQVHYQITSILQDVIKRGTARKALKLERSDLGGKTGTTNEQRDAWFNGFNPDLVATAWVGFDNFKPLGKNETGGKAALPIWIDYMGQSLEGKPDKQLLQPDGMVTIKIDPDTGHALAPGQPGGIFETFRKRLAPEIESSANTISDGTMSVTQPDIAEELF